MKMIDVVEAFGVGALGGYVVTRWMKKRAEKREPDNKIVHIPRPDGHAKTVVNTRERANQIVDTIVSKYELVKDDKDV